MVDIYDAVDWRNLVGKAGPKAGYVDGAVSAWPAQAWGSFPGDTLIRVTVLADERVAVFDSEAGNAGVMAVATAVADRFQAGLWSVCYTNANNLPALSAALKAKSQHWQTAEYWPAPGVYLWAAAPGSTLGQPPAWCPVQPVAVQDRWLAGYNISTAYATFPVLPPEVIDVTEQDKTDIINGVLLGMRQLMTPGSELHGRTIEACNESIGQNAGNFVAWAKAADAPGGMVVG